MVQNHQMLRFKHQSPLIIIPRRRFGHTFVGIFKQNAFWALQKSKKKITLVGINECKPQHARKHDTVDALGGLLRAPGGLAKTSHISPRKRPWQETRFLGSLFLIEKRAPLTTLVFGDFGDPPRDTPGSPGGAKLMFFGECDPRGFKMCSSHSNRLCKKTAIVLLSLQPDFQKIGDSALLTPTGFPKNRR